MESSHSKTLKFKRVPGFNRAKLLSGDMDDSESNSVTSYSSEKRMKKDDSGINVEKIHSSSSDEEEDSHRASARANAAGDTPSTSKKRALSELNSPDSGNPESFNDLHENEPEADLSSAAEAADSDTVSAEGGQESGGTKSAHDSDEENVLAKDSASTDEADDKLKYDPTPDTQKPKHKWSAPKMTLNREYGSQSRYSSHLFRYDCYGSLHMVERLELMYKMKKHDGCVNTLNFNSSGTRLVSGSDDLDVIIWDWAASEPVLEYNSGHRSNVFQAKFLPLSGDCQIVSCARDGQVRIAELSSTGICKSTRKLAQHKGAAHKLAVQMESPCMFMSCGEDAAVFEIDLREGKPEKLVVCKEDDKKVPLYSVFINPNKCYEYVVGGRDNFVRIYDKRCIRQEDGFLKKYCPSHLIGGDIKANVTSVCFSYNGEEILASYNDEDIYLFDSHATDTSKYLHRYKGHRNSQTVKGVNFFGPKSEYVISGSDCGYIFFWEKESEHIVNYMHGDEGGVVNCLEPNPNLPVLATSGLDDDIKIWVPSCEQSPSLSGLRDHVINNMKDREDERRNEPDAFDDQMIWLLMQHLRRARRRSHSGSGVAVASSSSSTSDSESPDDEAELHHAIQCNQS